MHTSYLTGTGWFEDIEMYNNKEFDDLWEAIEHLSENYDKLIEEFPVDRVDIKLIEETEEEKFTPHISIPCETIRRRVMKVFKNL